VTLLPQVADASTFNTGTGNYGTNASGYGCVGGNSQDNSSMTYYRSSLTAEMYNAVAYALNNAVAPTDISVQSEAGSAGSQTDVVYFDFQPPDNWCYAGQDWCPDNGNSGTGCVIGQNGCKSLTGQNCERFDILFNTYSTAGMTTSRRQNLACHETGHSLGFPHPASTSGCIGSTTILTYSSHEINDHINPHY
jgi:hypothetical protein